MALTDYELSLVPTAVEFINAHVRKHGKQPTTRELRDGINCGQPKAENVYRHVRENGLSEGNVPPQATATAPGAGRPTGAQAVLEENVIKGDVWKITMPRTTIHTLPQLLENCKVDLAEWEVEKWEANKWSMGFIKSSHKTEYATNPSTGVRESDKVNESGVQDLYQVKATLRRKRFATPTEYVLDNARLRSQVEKLKTRLASETQITKRLAQNHAGYDEFLANMKEFAQVIGDLSLPVEKLAPATPLVVPVVRDGHTEDAVGLWSDMHFGDRIRREDTSGFPEFDLVIGANRWGYVINKTKQCLTLHRAMYPIKRLKIWIGGDVGNGVLHDSPNSNELFTSAQVHFSYHMLKFGLEDLLTLTVPDAAGNVVIEGIDLLFSVGNHMRMDEKMPHKFQAQRTLDWLIYQFVIEKFSSNPKVTIKQEMSPYIFETIRGHKHLFAHGMQVGYRNSPDAQCKSMGQFIDRVRSLFDSPEWRRKNHVQGETFARICIGDIHVPVSFPRLISNGSLNGQNELGVNWVLEPIPAGQQLFGVADKHCETWKYFLECSQVQREKKDMNKYGDFALEYAEKLAR